MIRYRHPLLFIPLAAVVFSCMSSSRKAVDELALQLALRDELTSSQEAVVWALSDIGAVASYWIKDDLLGAAVVGTCEGLVLPLNGAVWRLENGDEDADYDAVTFRDLVSGDMMRIPLDESVEAADGGELDDAGTAGEEESAEYCEIYRIRGRPQPLSSVGPYVTLKYSEKTISCREETILIRDRYAVVDLSEGASVSMLNDTEIERLFERKDVRALLKEGEVSFDGTVPLYNPAFLLSFVHMFSATSMELTADGRGRGIVSSLEVRDTAVPERLKDFFLPPDLVRAFGASVPLENLGGFVAVNGDSEVVLNYLRAFISADTGGELRKKP